MKGATSHFEIQLTALRYAHHSGFSALGSKWRTTQQRVTLSSLKEGSNQEWGKESGFFIIGVLVWPSLWGEFDLMGALESSQVVVAVRAPWIWLIPSRMYRPSTDKFWTSIRPQSLPVGSQALILENKALLNICDVFY